MNFTFNRSFLFFLYCLCFTKQVYSQSYPPGVGQTGTTAIHKDSSAFVNWATACSVTRGYQDISNTSQGLASVGDASLACGKADGSSVVSLGDGGSAVCTFQKAITNGVGFDFAVFENALNDTFLELAFVEVSSDGVNFTRFPAHSLTDTVTQTDSFGATDATKINNLAGKYRLNYGTPFDLQELSGTVSLNINAITHVKIIDVVGSIDKLYANYDSFGNKVNDPWPTAFASGGFDLDAIGVIHENNVTGIAEKNLDKGLFVYPNPCNIGDRVQINSENEIESIELLDCRGSIIERSANKQVNTSSLKPGIYFLKIRTIQSSRIQKLVIL